MTIFNICVSISRLINFSKVLIDNMGAICVKNEARTASGRSSDSSRFKSGSHLNTIQTKMGKFHIFRGKTKHNINAYK